MSDARPASDERPADNGSLIQAVPGLVRIATGATLRSAGFVAETGLRVGSRLVSAAASGESTTELLRNAGEDVRDYARRLLGLGATPPAQPPPDMRPDQNGSLSLLRERGAELLRKSADVTFNEDSHPAYERILDDLSPDEARILRLLAKSGPQPAVDVRTGVLPVNTASELIAPGLNMIGLEAGCRHQDRVPAYLNNLERLGLIWFSRESLTDPLRYQVLEAQPEVGSALKEARLSRTVRRSIHLTPFGEDFCKTVLPEDITGEFAAGDADLPPSAPERGSPRPPAAP